LPEWDKARALTRLDITETTFTMTNGNVLGYAIRREIAISPLSPMPWKTTFHEIAQILPEVLAMSVTSRAEGLTTSPTTTTKRAG